ncbi:MAG: SusD/RagB family nutrient-binding outer membrane lipoprotein [Prevotella sp.]|nr:SusD/RagB family nutrient-binding outer membrane lipoprotein [Prevotella sp.]
MKKIFLIATAGLMLANCDMDINDNPNYPSGSDITPSLQFPAAINAVATAYGDALFNDAGFFVQYFDQRPEANQYNTLAELDIDETTDLFNRSYRLFYAGALQDLQEVAQKTDNTADLFVNQVMRTQTFQILVDCTDKTPYSEALQGSSNSTPKYDDGQVVYEGVLKELDDAEEAIKSTDIITMTDPILKSDLAQWKGYANALRLRMYLRFIDANINASEYTTKVKNLIAANEFFTGDVAWDVYSDQEGQWSPWFDTQFALANNHCPTYPLVEYYKAMNDPRISYVIVPRTSDNTYVGLYPGSKQENNFWGGSAPKNADVSTISYDKSHDAKICFFTQSELQFLIAEAQLRFNSNDAAAKTAYEAAVTEDFSFRGMADKVADFLAADGAWTGANADKLNLIYMQKWVALFMRDHVEAWSEQRRTDVPKISAQTAAQVKANPTAYTPGELLIPVRNLKGNGGLCLSFPYSSDSRRYNSSTPAARYITDRVFWDVK